jgi:hypothetical protein
MLEQGILPGIRLGRRWIITRHAYEQWERTCGMRPARDSTEQTQLIKSAEKTLVPSDIAGEFRRRGAQE